MLETIINGLHSLRTFFVPAETPVSERKNRSIDVLRVHLLESIAKTSETDTEVALDLFLHDFYEGTMLDDYLENLLETGRTDARYYVRQGIWSEMMISKAELGPWDVRKSFSGHLLPPKWYIPEERATAYLYISIGKREEEINDLTSGQRWSIPAYLLNYHPLTNQADVYLAYNGKITKRGTLPLSEEVKYVAAQYFPWKKNQVSPLSLVHPHKS